MSKLPAKLNALASDEDIAGASRELLLAVKFTANRKNNFDSVLSMMKSAEIFLASDEKKTSYLVGFSKTKAQANLAIACLEEMRISGWQYLLFANSRVQLRRQSMLNMLDCYGTASRLKDSTKHCHRTYDDAVERFVALNELKFNIRDAVRPHTSPDVSWRLPCQCLDGHVSMSAEEFKDPLPYIEAAAEARLVSACPLWKPSAFEVKALLSKPKRYW